MTLRALTSPPLSPPVSGWRRLPGGVVGSLAVLAVPLSLGLLAFAPLGPAAAQVGLRATFTAAVVAGVVYALLAGNRAPAAGPSSATALVLAGLVATLASSGDPPGGTALALVLLGCAAAVALSGLMQVALAAAGLARLAALVPRPVLAGFMNGVALLIVVGQLPLLLGLLPGSAVDASALRTALAEPGPWLLGLGTVVVVLALQRYSRWPAPLTALAAGTLLVAALSAIWPGLWLGHMVGTLPMTPAATPLLPPLLQPAPWQALAAHAPAVVGTAAVLALIGALESLLGLLALDEQLDTRHDPRRELMALGAANLASGLLGGLPAVVLRARAIAMAHAGGTGRAAAVAGALSYAVVFLFGGPLLDQLPLAVLGGIMVTVALALVDGWSGQLLRRGWPGRGAADLRAALAVMLAVCGMTLWLGFVAGVALGVVLSTALFVARMNRSPLRLRLTAAERPSRRIYPDAVEAMLQPLRRDIEIWELDGTLFFGNASRLLQLADALPTRTRVLVLDIRRVNSIDETGAAALGRLQRLLGRRSTLLLLCGMAPGSASQLALDAADHAPPPLPDADQAIEAAERHLLGAAAQTALAACPVPESQLLQGLDDLQAAAVMRVMAVRQLQAGELLFRQGDPPDGLYVLTRGSVSVIGRDGPRTQRYLSLSPGMMIGETALLDGRHRSADAVADGDAELHHLPAAALAALEATDPATAARLHRNMAVYLSRRLRAVSIAWQASQA